MEKDKKKLAYSGLYFGMTTEEVKKALENDTKIVRETFIKTSDGEILLRSEDDEKYYNTKIFEYSYGVRFCYNYKFELYRLNFFGESFITNENFDQGILEYEKLVNLFESKYGIPEVKKIGNKPSDTFYTRWELEKEINIFLLSKPLDKERFPLVMSIAYMPMVLEEERYKKENEDKSIETELTFI